MIHASEIVSRRVPILMYHSISEQTGAKFRPFVVAPALFAEHMRYLQEHRYTPITITQLIKMLYQGKEDLPERSVALTFDDGFADFFTNALPVLKRYSFAATLYIPTAFVGGTSRWLWREEEADRPMLTWDQISIIWANGIECGAHSHSHPQLDLVPRSTACDEIRKSKQILEAHLDQPIASFAYPHGYHTAHLQRVVREAGYTSACAVKYEMNVEKTDPFALARLLVLADTDLASFSALLAAREASRLVTLYRYARTPVWRYIRHFSSSTTQYTSTESVHSQGGRL